MEQMVMMVLFGAGFCGVLMLLGGTLAAVVCTLVRRTARIAFGVGSLYEEKLAKEIGDEWAKGQSGPVEPRHLSLTIQRAIEQYAEAYRGIGR